MCYVSVLINDRLVGYHTAVGGMAERVARPPGSGVRSQAVLLTGVSTVGFWRANNVNAGDARLHNRNGTRFQINGGTLRTSQQTGLRLKQFHLGFV